MVLTWGPTWGLLVVAGILQVAVMNLLWRMLWARCWGVGVAGQLRDICFEVKH